MSTVIGLISAILLIVGAILIDTDIRSFINLQGMLIVILGTVAVTSISFRFKDMMELPQNVLELFRQGQRDPANEATRMLKIAVEVRKLNDLKALEKLLPRFNDTPVLAKAMSLVADGAAGDEIEQLMRRENSSIAARHMRSVDCLRRAGDIAPAMGLIGTLIGLVKMLGSLDDPATIGPAMAVALLTTLYGAFLAHLVFIPLAAKTEFMTSEEALVNNIYAMAATSIGRKENPRRLETLLNTILPPSKRVKYFR